MDIITTGPAENVIEFHTSYQDYWNIQYTERLKESLVL
jgi:hypothetical protein